MKEATLRDFFLGTTPALELAAEARDAVEPRSQAGRRVRIQDLPAGEQVTVTAPMLIRLCDAVLAGELPAPSLEAIAFAVVVSEHLHWAEDDELVARVLYDWASPEITWDLTGENVQMFRDWLTGAVRPPSEPEVTNDTLSGWGRWTVKVPLEPS